MTMNATVQAVLQSGVSTVEQELVQAGETALADLATIINEVKTALTGGETPEQVVTQMLNTAESMGLSIVENFATATLAALAGLLVKALPALI